MLLRISRTSWASAGWRVQSKDPRLLSLIVEVVRETDPKLRSFLQTIEEVGRVDVVIKHIDQSFGHVGDVEDAQPKFNDVPYLLCGGSRMGKDLIPVSGLRNCNLLEEIFVGHIAAILGDAIRQ